MIAYLKSNGAMALVWLAFVGAGGCTKKAPPRVAQPNVVLVSLDTLRADALRAYDDAANPHETLDGLSKRGHTFERAYSTASWTLPAHVSIFTGLYPARHGVVDSRYAMGDTPTFVEALRDAGYETVGFADGGYVGPQYGFTRGFEIYDGWRDGKGSVPADALPRGGKRPTDTRAAVFDRATAFLAERTDPRPLFLFAHTYAVHDYFRDWQRAENEEPPTPTPESNAKLDCLLGRSQCSAAEWAGFEADYQRGVAETDQALGGLLQLIDDKLGLEKTVVIVVSDHGEGFEPKRARIHHGGRLHRDQLEIPFIVAGPGIAPGRSDAPVSLVDVGPTLLELAGAPPASDVDGRSLVPALFRNGRLDADRRVYATEYTYFWKDGQRQRVPKPAMRPLLAATIDEHHWAIKTPSGYEVYETDDPTQRRPLVADGYTPPPAPERPLTRAKPVEVQETMEVIEQLRALGYIQ